MRPRRLHASRIGAGFTLIELMVVIAILAVLAAIAYPSYIENIRKSKRAEGKSALLKALQLEERAYTSNGTYTTDLGPLFGLGTGVTPKSGEDPTLGNYDLTAAVDPANGSDLRQGVIITATPRAAVFSTLSPPDPVCGIFTISSTGVRTFENPASKGSKDLCW